MYIICIYIHVYVSMYVYISIYMYICRHAKGRERHICMCPNKCICICMHHTHIYTHTYIHTHRYIYIYIHICKYKCMPLAVLQRPAAETLPFLWPRSDVSLYSCVRQLPSVIPTRLMLSPRLFAGSVALALARMLSVL